MRKVLLATAAFAFIGAGQALAVGPGEVTINSHVEPACSLVSSDSEVDVGPGTDAANVEFTTTCNFSVADITITFSSANGGVLNTLENELQTYTLTYDGSAVSALGLFHTAMLPSGPSAGDNILRTATVALDEALTVAGDYQDTLTISVSP